MGEAPLEPASARHERLRNAALSVLIVVTLAAVIVHLLPSSRLQADLLTVARPYAAGLGLDQNWGVFAPDPRPQTLNMRARIRYADGSTEWWNMPTGGSLVGEYWDYRWRKWLEYIINNDYRSILWRPLASWIAREHHDRTHTPVRITFVARWYDIYPPGVTGPLKGQLRSGWRESAYYTVPVTPTMLRGA